MQRFKMATVVITLEVTPQVDLEVTTDLTAGGSTFKIINSATSATIIQGPLSTLIALVDTFNDWNKTALQKLKAFSKT